MRSRNSWTSCGCASSTSRRQVLGDLAPAAADLGQPLRGRPARVRETRQLQAGRPALGGGEDGVHRLLVGVAAVQPHELGDLARGRATARPRGTRRRRPPPASSRAEGPDRCASRCASCAPVGQVPQHEGDDLPGLVAREQVRVVEDQDETGRRGQRLAEQRQDPLAGPAAPPARATPDAGIHLGDRLERQREVREQDDGVGVGFVELHPGEGPPSASAHCRRTVVLPAPAGAQSTTSGAVVCASASSSARRSTRCTRACGGRSLAGSAARGAPAGGAAARQRARTRDAVPHGGPLACGHLPSPSGDAALPASVYVT